MKTFSNIKRAKYVFTSKNHSTEMKNVMTKDIGRFVRG